MSEKFSEPTKTTVELTKARLLEFNEVKLLVARQVGRRLKTDEFLHYLVHLAKWDTTFAYSPFLLEELLSCNRDEEWRDRTFMPEQ